MSTPRTCHDCQVPLVSYGQTPGPGQKAHQARGYCGTCYRRYRRSKDFSPRQMPTACASCQIPMVARAPGPVPDGTRRHAAHGYCSACYDRRQTGNNTPAPAPVSTPTCTAITGACDCHWCEAAAEDHESPLALVDGAWVPGRHGIREWVA